MQLCYVNILIFELLIAILVWKCISLQFGEKYKEKVTNSTRLFTDVRNLVSFEHFCRDFWYVMDSV